MPEAPDDPSAEPVTALLRQLGHRASTELSDGLAAAGFTDVRPVDTAVFKLLGPGGTRLTDLATRTGATKQALTFVIDRLVRDGYVERVPDPSDHRAKLIRLTPAGARASGVASAAVAQLETRWRATVGAAEWHALRATLARLISGVTCRWRSQDRRDSTWRRRRSRRRSQAASASRSHREAGARPRLVAS